MASDISTELRRLIFERANGQCEYCQFPQKYALHKHEPDHIIPRQHGGKTSKDNLALACMRCNRHKGPNVGSFDPETGKLVPFFNPRNQSWSEHFQWLGAKIQPITPRGRVTAIILKLNGPQRLSEREHLMNLGLYS